MAFVSFDVDVTELEDLGLELSDVADFLATNMEDNFQVFIDEELIPQLLAEVAAGTPRSDESSPLSGKMMSNHSGEEPGKLRDSTVPADSVYDSSDGMVALLSAILQPAVSDPNWDGTGGDFPYMDTVETGRDAIAAPSTGPWSTGKMAMRTPQGPRRFVGDSFGSASVGYLERLDPVLLETTSVWTESWAERLLARTIAELGG